MSLVEQGYMHKDFLTQHIKESYTMEAIPADASFRRYERIILPQNKTLIFMDSSQEKASAVSFSSVCAVLSKGGYSVPKIFAEDTSRGLMIIEDLGTQSYSSILEQNDQELEETLYYRAIDVLLDIQRKIDTSTLNIPEYSNKILLDEALLLVDWYFPALNGYELKQSERAEYVEIWNKILDKIHYENKYLVLRDYHVDNLMWLEDRYGIERVGLLDFQDALIGSRAYDLVSLLEDARRDIKPALVAKMLNYYIESSESLNRKDFIADYTILGVQRSCKVVGVFARKAMRDNNNKYLKHLPRVLSYIRSGLEHPLLHPLRDWFEKVDIPVLKNGL